VSYWEDPRYSAEKLGKEFREYNSKKHSFIEIHNSMYDIERMLETNETHLPLISNEYIFAKVIRKSEVESFSKEKDPFLDIIEYKNKTSILIELQGINKEDIKINFYGNKLEIFGTSRFKKYKGIIKMSFKIQDDNIMCNYNNSLLEIVLKR
jgi:HSP20 family molecular chaperone IbpA